MSSIDEDTNSISEWEIDNSTETYNPDAESSSDEYHTDENSSETDSAEANAGSCSDEYDLNHNSSETDEYQLEHNTIRRPSARNPEIQYESHRFFLIYSILDQVLSLKTYENLD